MTISKKLDGGALTVALEGRLDTTTAPELEKEFKESLPAADALTLDLKELDYVSSAGLRVILSAHKTMANKGGLKIVNVSRPIMEIFEVTGFSEILTIE